MQSRWHIAKSDCDEKKRKYVTRTSQYQSWQKSVRWVELRLASVEERLNQSCDPATSVVRTYIHVAISHFTVWISLLLSRIATCTDRPQGVIIVGIYVFSNIYYLLLLYLKGHSGAELHIYFLVHLESIYYEIFFYSKIVPNCAVAK